MGVSVTLENLFEKGPGRWEYRRRVPTKLKAAFGQTEWKRVITARNDAELAREHARVVAEFERLVKEAKATLPGPLSPRAQWLAAVARADALASGVIGVDDEDEARNLVAESLPRSDTLTIQALMDPLRAPPSYNLHDARDLYLKEYLKGGEGEDRRQSKVGLDRVFGRLEAALGARAAVALSELKREDARKVRDHMLATPRKGGGTLSVETVRRELNQVKAVVSYAIREFDLVGKAVNPFDKLDVGPGMGSAASSPDSEKRLPLPSKVIEGVRGRLASRTKTPDLFLIWRMLEGTGCRLTEITGLQVDDVHLISDLPHIKVRWNENRRLKTEVSVRSVPLVGDAFNAAKEALSLPREVAALFPRYGRGRRGGDAASQMLMKHLHAVVEDKQLVTHSLRHNVKDRLQEVEASELVQNLILGHALGGVGNRVYGGDRAKLLITTK
jgi:integrase